MRAQAVQSAAGAMTTLEKVQKALHRHGVVSTRLIFALDLTKANKSAGARSLHGAAKTEVALLCTFCWLKASSRGV